MWIGNLSDTGFTGAEHRGEPLLNVTFFGVRGSTPCPCPANGRYGGNTACVALESPGVDPLCFDLGTGLRFWGESLGCETAFRGSALVSHLHWDHVQGLPFFVPALHEGSHLDIYGPPPDAHATLDAAFRSFLAPPFFPVDLDGLPGTINFHELDETDQAIGDAKVTARQVPHVGITYGYRVELGGVQVAYLSDHQQPGDGSFGFAAEALELVDGVDLVIHDAQYTPEEFARKPDWGHCTIEYAVRLAAEAGAKRLALFHHDPTHDDAMLDRLSGEAAALGDRLGLDEVFAAHEGLTVSYSEAEGQTYGI